MALDATHPHSTIVLPTCKSRGRLCSKIWFNKGGWCERARLAIAGDPCPDVKEKTETVYHLVKSLAVRAPATPLRVGNRVRPAAEVWQSWNRRGGIETRHHDIDLFSADSYAGRCSNCGEKCILCYTPEGPLLGAECRRNNQCMLTEDHVTQCNPGAMERYAATALPVSAFSLAMDGVTKPGLCGHILNPEGKNSNTPP